MKTMIKRMSVIAMAFMVAANMAACIGLDQIQARQVEQALEARYGEEFKVTGSGIVWAPVSRIRRKHTVIR